MAKRRSAKQEAANGLVENGAGKKKVNGTSLAKSEEHKVRGDSGKSAKLNGDSPHAETKEVEANTAAHGDGAAITLLMFLYLLQGIPLGLAGCLPYLLQDRKVSYTDQAVLSLIFWPYSVKLLWAPLVDCLYVSRFGRRKSWLVPTQYLIGLFMVGLSTRINVLMGDEEDPLGQGQGQGSVNVTLLAALFFALNFLAATQDVAVDGWALTMLSRANVGWASTCNAVGQTAGYFLGNVVFLMLQSADFCNSYIRSEPKSVGLVTFQEYLLFWGVVYIGLTSMVMIFKHETSDLEDGQCNVGVIGAYRQLWRIVRLPSVLQLIIVLLTAKMGFAAADAVTGLKLIEEGMPKETLTLLGVIMMPLEIILPLFLSRHTVGSSPMNIYLTSVPFRLLLGLAFVGVVYYAPVVKMETGGYPIYFYIILVLGLTLHQVSATCMYVANMSFFAKVSDPAIGGTYMTLLNTVTNFAGSWPSTLVLSSMDHITWRTCHPPNSTLTITDCSTKLTLKECEAGGGRCETTMDGYYVSSVICCVLGFVWMVVMAPRLRRLQSLTPATWSVTKVKV